MPASSNPRIPASEDDEGPIVTTLVKRPAEEPAGGEMRAQFLGRSARFQVAVAIAKANDAIGVGDVEILRLRAGRIKGDAERFL